MSLRFPDGVFPALFVGLFLLWSAHNSTAQPRALTVCADPDNLPFSNVKQQGFENQIASIVARDLQRPLVYKWQREDRGFVRDYINKSACDVLIGNPTGDPQLLTTSSYYRSSYVFVYKEDSKTKPASLDDPALRDMKIGVQAVGEEYTPPGDALARRGLQAAIVPYHTTGGDENQILDAVEKGKINTAVVWGPPAGYFAKLYHPNLRLVLVSPEMDPPGLPFTFAISMGVRKGNNELRDELDRSLRLHASEIHKILTSYGVPLLGFAGNSRTGP